MAIDAPDRARLELGLCCPISGAMTHRPMTAQSIVHTTTNMSTYADIAAENAPSKADQPKADQGYLEGHNSHEDV